jgi:holo-[acyl-carrier protein] synthase
VIRQGVDVVDIKRLQNALAQSPRLADRLFTEKERAYADSRSRPEEHLAARVAAKEATFKALGHGWPEISWRDVEVVSNGGPPALALRGKAAEFAGEAQASISLSHDAGIAIAQVILDG